MQFIKIGQTVCEYLSIVTQWNKGLVIWVIKQITQWRMNLTHEWIPRTGWKLDNFYCANNISLDIVDLCNTYINIKQLNDLLFHITMVTI